MVKSVQFHGLPLNLLRFQNVSVSLTFVVSAGWPYHLSECLGGFPKGKEASTVVPSEIHQLSSYGVLVKPNCWLVCKVIFCGASETLCRLSLSIIRITKIFCDLQCSFWCEFFRCQICSKNGLRGTSSLRALSLALRVICRCWKASTVLVLAFLQSLIHEILVFLLWTINCMLFHRLQKRVSAVRNQLGRHLMRCGVKMQSSGGDTKVPAFFPVWHAS